jgi:quercetin dioxygenase-like cupin family protein
MNMAKVCLSLFTFSLLASAQVAPSDATLEFENSLVRIVRVQYKAHQKTAMHDHPATPTVYVYVTDGGRLRIGHEGEEPVIRPVVKAGAIRFQHAVAERHVVEELDGVASEYLRLELKAQPPDQPPTDVRRAPDDRTPYESPTLRILRVTCPAHGACPASAHPEDAAVVVTGREFRWEPPRSEPAANPSGTAWEQVRVEIVAPARK